MKKNPVLTNENSQSEVLQKKIMNFLEATLAFKTASESATVIYSYS